MCDASERILAKGGVEGVRARGAALSPDARGALHMVLAAVMFTVGAAAIKRLSAELPASEVVFFRHVFATLCFLPMIWRAGPATLRTDRPLGHAWRALVGYGSFVAFVYAMTRLTLADAMALSFTGPLWSTLLAVAILHEAVGLSRVAALIVGFAGVLLVAKPSGAVGWASLIALTGAIFQSLAMLAVKRLSRTEPTERIAFYFLALGALFAAVPAALEWRTPGAAHWPWLAAVGVLAWLGQLGLTRGYALGQFSRMAPMEFLRLPLALVIGFVAFAETPDLLASAGMLLIGFGSSYSVVGGRARRPSSAR